MAGNFLLCCQPMTNYRATYKNVLFIAERGYWWVNGKGCGLITEVRDEINRMIEYERLAGLSAPFDPFVEESQPQ